MRTQRKRPRAAPWTSEAWVAYYRGNAQNPLPLPLARGAELTDAEKAALAPSLQDFQLGESSEGRHLRARAEAYAITADDPAYAEAMTLFVREEQRHAKLLAEFMAAAGIPLCAHTRLNTAFRWFRRCAGLEVSLGVLLTAEMVGKVYYRAIHRATGSEWLRGICAQLLRDEVRHLRFHCERLALVRRERPRWKLWLTYALHRFFFGGSSLLVWLKHRRAFRAGGVSFSAYWRQCRKEWQAYLRKSHPHCDCLYAAPGTIEPRRIALARPEDCQGFDANAPSTRAETAPAMSRRSVLTPPCLVDAPGP